MPVRSVKQLSRKKGACAINFNEFTLDKGKSNPNSIGISKTKGIKSVDEIYERQKAAQKGKKKSRNQQMLASLKAKGALLLGKEKRPRKKKEGKSKERRKRKSRKNGSSSGKAKKKQRTVINDFQWME